MDQLWCRVLVAGGLCVRGSGGHWKFSALCAQFGYESKMTLKEKVYLKGKKKICRQGEKSQTMMLSLVNHVKTVFLEPKQRYFCLQYCMPPPGSSAVTPQPNGRRRGRKNPELGGSRQIWKARSRQPPAACHSSMWYL